jgi:hypothetical protein
MGLLDQATHGLFDMDGVLLDTEPLYTIVYDRVMAPYGASLDWETKSTMMGRAAPASARLVIEKFGLPAARAPRHSGLQQAVRACRPVRTGQVDSVRARLGIPGAQLHLLWATGRAREDSVARLPTARAARFLHDLRFWSSVADRLRRPPPKD